MRSNRLGHSASSPQGQARVVAPNALDVRLTQASMPAHRLLGIGTRNHCDVISDGVRLRPFPSTRESAAVPAVSQSRGSAERQFRAYRRVSVALTNA